MVYDKKMIEDRHLRLFENSVNPLYYYDITSIWDIIEDLEKDINKINKRRIGPLRIEEITNVEEQIINYNGIKLRINKDTQFKTTYYR